MRVMRTPIEAKASRTQIPPRTEMTIKSVWLSCLKDACAKGCQSMERWSSGQRLCDCFSPTHIRAPYQNIYSQSINKRILRCGKALDRL